MVEVRGLTKVFVARGLFTAAKPVVAVQDVSFSVTPGEALALVGESGSGKSTIARIMLRLEKPNAGEILLDGVNVLAQEPHGASLSYRRRVQMIFQDPFGSLNPIHDIAHHLTRPLLRHHRATRADAHSKAIDLLHTVGLEPANEFIGRHPYELSGGQRQRVAIARALAVDPDLLVADEPTSMLDVSIRMDILNLLARLKSERGLAMVVITHDLASARFLADRVLVLFRGRIVEDGPAAAVVESPAHPYTRALLDAIADVGDLDARRTKTVPAEAAGATAPEEPSKQRGQEEVKHPGEQPAMETLATEEGVEEHESSGCPFAPRCPNAMDICWSVDPTYRAVDGRRVRCHLYPEEK